MQSGRNKARSLLTVLRHLHHRHRRPHRTDATLARIYVCPLLLFWLVEISNATGFRSTAYMCNRTWLSPAIHCPISLNATRPSYCCVGRGGSRDRLRTHAELWCQQSAQAWRAVDPPSEHEQDDSPLRELYTFALSNHHRVHVSRTGFGISDSSCVLLRLGLVEML